MKKLILLIFILATSSFAIVTMAYTEKIPKLKINSGKLVSDVVVTDLQSLKLKLTGMNINYVWDEDSSSPSTYLIFEDYAGLNYYPYRNFPQDFIDYANKDSSQMTDSQVFIYRLSNPFPYLSLHLQSLEEKSAILVENPNSLPFQYKLSEDQVFRFNSKQAFVLFMKHGDPNESQSSFRVDYKNAELQIKSSTQNMSEAWVEFKIKFKSSARVIPGDITSKLRTQEPHFVSMRTLGQCHEQTYLESPKLDIKIKSWQMQLPWFSTTKKYIKYLVCDLADHVGQMVYQVVE